MGLHYFEVGQNLHHYYFHSLTPGRDTGIRMELGRGKGNLVASSGQGS